MTYTHVSRHVLRLDAKARIYRTIFRDYTCCNDPTIQQRVDALRGDPNGIQPVLDDPLASVERHRRR